MGRRKRDLRRPPGPEADWGTAEGRGEEIPLIEAQDPAVIDQQEGPVRAQAPAPEPKDPDRPEKPPGAAR